MLIPTAHAADARLRNDLADLSLEELGEIKVSSVSKRAEPLSTAAAAVYVITPDDIRRSGAVSLPEMLRLAPNLQVGMVNASSYVISARGFNTEFSNKLLVLIDGRSVYTPLYSGVFWNAQDVVPESIDRIEVISGPGGTLWGANAVNGVINVVTKDSHDTQGFAAALGGGTFERNAALQYGGKFSDSTAYRAYLKGFRRGHTVTSTGADAMDTWESMQGGFRLDWDGAEDKITVQGDIYDGSIPHTRTVDRSISGHNVLARWTRTLGAASSLQVQTYYDSNSQSIEGAAANAVDTYDIELQHSLSAGARYDVVWGGGYRFVRDHFRNAPGAAITPASRNLDLGNLFAEGSVRITQGLKFSAGLKLEHNVYTGWEYLPSARLSWQVDGATLLWSSVSRSVRTPSRLDRDLVQPGFLLGGPDFGSEVLVAYEAGYRAQFGDKVTLSVSAFYNDYDDLRTLEITPVTLLPLRFDNGMEGETYGIEAWGNYAPLPWWRLSAGLMLMKQKLRLKPGSVDLGGFDEVAADPSHQISLRSSMVLPHDLEFSVGLRIVDALRYRAVPGYTELDARLGWNLNENVTLSIAGTNLLNNRHAETGLAASTAFRRGVYASISWRQ